MELEAIVVGAGPAGLATSRELLRRGVSHRVLERGDRLGYSWANYYDSLVLHTGKHMSALPGLRFPASAPLYPAREEFLAYLDRYATKFQLPIETGAEVARIERAPDRWIVQTRTGASFAAKAVVIATGISANPVMPEIPGRERFRGCVRHSVEYQRPGDCRGRRVLVVGVGNSGAEISSELARAGAVVTIAVRSGAVIVPRDIAGIPIQYISILVGWLPRRAQRAAATLMGRAAAAFRPKAALPPPNPSLCVRVPIIGFHLTDALRTGTIRLKGGLDAFTSDGVKFSDGSTEAFDEVILATGFRAAVGMLGDQIGLDACGYGQRRSRVISTDQPDLYFVGHNPDVRGGIFSMGRDAARAAKHIARRR